MKTIVEIKDLYVSARELAYEASPSSVDAVADKLKQISDHCKELYKIEKTYLERAKCINLYESLDNIISILKSRGFLDPAIVSFFGFDKNGSGISFGDLAMGKGTVKAPVMPNPTFASPIEMPINSVEQPTYPHIDVKSPNKDDSKGECGVTSVPPKTSAPTVNLKKENPTPVKANDVPPTIVGARNGGSLPSIDEMMVPKYLDDFIGQEDIKRRLKDKIEAAKKLGEKHIDNILLIGTRGLGKTTLMEIIANELGLQDNYVFIDCTKFQNNVESQKIFHQVFMRIIEKNAPVVIGCDEVHALSTRMQETLYTLLEKRVYAYLTNSGESKVIPIKEFTFIGATTDYQKLAGPFKDRCIECLMHDYTREELCTIMERKLVSVGLSMDRESVVACINRCHSSIREVAFIIKELRPKAVNAGANFITREMVETYFKEVRVDAIGLKSKSLEILNAIKSEQTGVISEETLAARVSLEPSILTQEYEPLLLKMGFISITNKGRCLTVVAENYLKYGYYRFSDGSYVGQLPPDMIDPDNSGEPQLEKPISFDDVASEGGGVCSGDSTEAKEPNPSVGQQIVSPISEENDDPNATKICKNPVPQFENSLSEHVDGDNHACSPKEDVRETRSVWGQIQADKESQKQKDDEEGGSN